MRSQVLRIIRQKRGRESSNHCWVLAGAGQAPGVPCGDSDLGRVLRGRFCQMPRLSVVGTHASLPALSLHPPPPLPFPAGSDVYEEAIRTVMTVWTSLRCSTATPQFEESMIAAKMETA